MDEDSLEVRELLAEILAEQVASRERQLAMLERIGRIEQVLEQLLPPPRVAGCS